MSTERERKIQEKSLRLIRQYNGYVYKNAQNIYTEKGRPDLTACIPVSIKKLIKLFGENGKVGIFVGIELKRPGHLNGVSEAQKIVGRQIKKSNGLWFVIDDTDVVEAMLLGLTED